MSVTRSLRMTIASAIAIATLTACEGDDNTLPFPADAASDAAHDGGSESGASAGDAAAGGDAKPDADAGEQ